MQGQGKSNQELFLASFEGDYDDAEPWAAIRELRLRNTEPVFQIAASYCRSALPLQRARALDVLAQLGTGKPQSERPHLEESIEIGIDHLDDPDPGVRSSAAWALSHLGGDRSISALIGMISDPDPGVRHAVACGIAGSLRPDAVETLLLLMEDLDDDVRDWATFGLGTLTNEDSPQVRSALRTRLDDSFENAAKKQSGD